MTLYRVLLRSLRRSCSMSTTTAAATGTSSAQTLFFNHHLLNPNFLLPARSFAFSSAEEAAAERRRRKRRLRIEPPLYALRRDNSAPRPPPDPNAPRLPDSTSALVGPRLSLHNRVQSLIRAGDLDNACAVARQAVFSNTRPTVFTCNAIMAAMYRGKRFAEAKGLFHYFFRQFNIVPNVVSYNVLINTLCDDGDVDEGLKIYQEIIANAPFSPSSVTYRHLTKGLIDAGRIGEAVDLLREMLNKGHGADSLVYNNLISGFLNLENLDKANELFDELKERCLVYDGVVNATFMDWFFNKGREREAMESYRSLMDRQFRMVPATCNVLLEVLLKHERKAEAWTLFDKMLDDHTPPTFQAVNSDTFNLMVNECFKLGKISEAFDAFKKAGKAPKSKPFAMDAAGYNNIIIRYCENDMMEDAENMFAELCGKSLSPDVTTYRTLIDAYFKLDMVDDALLKYTKMVEAGLRVIPPYANKWFGILIDKCKAVECASILTKMGEKDPKPDAMTYDIVIRSLCKQGNLDLSLDLLGQLLRYGIGVPASLKDFAYEAFSKEGRSEEIERLLNSRWPAYGAYPPPPRPYQMSGHVARSPQLRVQETESPQMAGQVARLQDMGAPGPGCPRLPGNVAPPQMGGPDTWSPQMAGQAGRHPQMGGPDTWSPQMAGQAGRHPQMGGRNLQMEAQLAAPPQMGGPGTWSPQMAGQAGRHPQMGGVNPQTAEQLSGPPQMGGPGTCSPQMDGQVSRTPQFGAPGTGSSQASAHSAGSSPLGGPETESSQAAGQLLFSHTKESAAA